MNIIESEGHVKVADYPAIQYEVCSGCGHTFESDQIFEPFVDRVRKRSYLIHPNCWDQLCAKLKGGNNGNLPPWAQS